MCLFQFLSFFFSLTKKFSLKYVKLKNAKKFKKIKIKKKLIKFLCLHYNALKFFFNNIYFKKLAKDLEILFRFSFFIPKMQKVKKKIIKQK